ncbi:MAG: 3'(2'),5'-bisphosphate nucleotidase [Planctomycetota bacterium]|nr:MAG: 3'(2'),5'-bisphosphate nucleotidase [Planctomycetota bacterium]
MNFLLSPETEFAVEAVREAALLVRRVQQEMVVGALAKDDKSPVTVADFSAQALVAQRLADRFPGAALMGEESAVALRTEAGRETLEQITRFVRTAIPTVAPEEICDWIDRGVQERRAITWALDPVDGTKGFLRREQYAVALAYIDADGVQIGVLGCPELEEARRPSPGGAGSLLLAVRGQGAWTQPLVGGGLWRQLRVSDIAHATDARLLRSVEKGHTDTGGIGRLVDTLGIAADPVPMDSQAKYAVLAAGGGDVLLRLLSPSRPDYRERIWDQAAGSIVVEEAGGRVSDLDGKPLDFSQGRALDGNRRVLATNGRLHEAILSGLKQIGA